MQIKFWGTRGSIGNASEATRIYGGNTSCVEVRTQSGAIIVIDCGSGAFGLGQALQQEPGPGHQGHLLISHTHWDHIQGIPFFAPLFEPENSWSIYAPHGLHQSLRDTMLGQMNYTYSPITLNDLGADIQYHELVEGEFDIDDVRIKTQFLNHPSLTLGYRLEVDGLTLVYACDHEQVSKRAEPNESDFVEMEAGHVAFLENADIVIHDAQYLSSEYKDKAGWGHSTVEFAVAACQRANVRHLVLTHHDPQRSDQEIDDILAGVRSSLKVQDSTLRVTAAKEHIVLDLKPVMRRDPQLRATGFQAKDNVISALKKHFVLITSLRPQTEALVETACRAEHITIQRLSTQHPPWSQENLPTLIFVDSDTPDAETSMVLERLDVVTMDADWLPPVVVISYNEDGAGVSMDGSRVANDWMSWPFSEQYLRAKLRAWVLRISIRWQPAHLPANEEERLDSLHKLNILDTQSEERFDRITRLAANSMEVPIAVISLVDRDRQWFKSCIGLDAEETGRESAFCAHAILEKKPLMVPDTLLDPRFADNPLVTGAPHIRFYAGCPIYSPEGFALGTLCLIDYRPRQLDARQLGVLADLAAMVEAEIREN